MRVDDQDRETFKAAASPPLNYAKQGATIDLASWRLPERLFDEPDELVVWEQAAPAAARRVAAKRGRPSAPARKPRTSPAKRRDPRGAP